MNEHVTRCQSVLQEDGPDNDCLVYFPLHDVLQDPDHPLAGKLAIEGDWLFQLPAMDVFRKLWQRGYAFDYVSDRQIAELAVLDGQLVAPGGAYEAFAGTAVYVLTFDAPGPEGSWLLDLGTVHGSARVRLNGKEKGTLIGPSFRLALGALEAHRPPSGTRGDPSRRQPYPRSGSTRCAMADLRGHQLH